MAKSLSSPKAPIALNTAHGDLACIPREQLEAIHAAQSTRTYQKGQILFYEGNRAFGLHYLNSGKVKLSTFTPDGKVYITRIMTAGDLLGCHAFFTGETYAVTAEVLEEATVCFLEQDDVHRLFDANPLFGMQLINKLGKQLRSAEHKAADIAYKSVPERLAELLLTLRDSCGEPLSEDQVRLDISLSREDLASMIGTTVETIVRTLSRFRQLDLIGSEKKQIVLKSVGRLSSMVAA